MDGYYSYSVLSIRYGVLIFRFILCVALWSFSYLLWQIYELVKFLAAHAKARAKQIQIDNEENQD